MPVPRNRGKKTNKKRKAITAYPHPNDADGAYLVDIDNAERWEVVVDILCNYFELPDLTTRNGLKKVHANFATIYARIDKFYEKNLSNVRIRGAILAIFSKMCVDSILRNKLFEKGIVDRIIPTLDIDETRHLALCALSTITNHGGSNIRIEIAKNGNAIAKLLRDFPDDENLADLGVTVLAHSFSAVAEGSEKPSNSKALQKPIDMVDIIKTTLETIKRPHYNPRHMIDHAVELMTYGTLHAASAFKAYPPAIGFLVAGMRSKDWATRCTCFGGLIRLHVREAEDDQKGMDYSRFVANIRKGLPVHLGDILADYGAYRSETYLAITCTGELQEAITTSARTQDLYTLGLKEVELILRTEFAIADGTETEDDRLPFKRWGDSLPYCSRAIRNKKDPKEEDLADILDIKYAIMKGRISEAVRIAKKCIQRNPHQAYFYYAITLESADTVQGLRAAKQGLKCKQITPFVKYQLMQRAVQHAGEMGILLLLRMPEVGDKKWEEGVAFLTSALNDATAYMDGAPPDNRHMKNVAYWRVLLTVLLADDLSPDLRELKPCLEKLKIADEFSVFMGVPPPKTNFRLAQQAVVKHYATGVREFSRVFAELDKDILKDQGGEVKPNPAKLEDNLATWLEGMHLEDGTWEETAQCRGSAQRPRVIFENLKLYLCSWCGNPSAVLKKCSGCEKTRYCDSGCQKLHWSEHKKVCKN